jgi:hypothetical protein
MAPSADNDLPNGPFFIASEPPGAVFFPNAVAFGGIPPPPKGPFFSPPLIDDLPNDFELTVGSTFGGMPTAGPPTPDIPPPPNGFLLSGAFLKDALANDLGLAAGSDFEGMPGEKVDPPSGAAPFIGAFPNEEGAAAFVGIPPPPPNGLLFSELPTFGGDAPNDLGAGGGVCFGAIPFALKPGPPIFPESFGPPTNPFCGVFSNDDGIEEKLCFGGVPRVGPFGGVFPNTLEPGDGLDPNPLAAAPVLSLPFRGVWNAGNAGAG